MVLTTIILFMLIIFLAVITDLTKELKYFESNWKYLLQDLGFIDKDIEFTIFKRDVYWKNKSAGRIEADKRELKRVTKEKLLECIASNDKILNFDFKSEFLTKKEKGLIALETVQKEGISCRPPNGVPLWDVYIILEDERIKGGE